MVIFLIGFMGSGKSFTGRVLAEELNYDFVDMDSAIESLEGRSIKEIFEKEGEEYFRKLEQKSIQGLQLDKNVVVATGGGAPCFYDNIEAMNKKGLTVFLNPPTNVIVDRLINEKDKRPLLNKVKDKADLTQFVNEQLAKRLPFYKRAALEISDNNVQSIIRNIL